MTQLAKAKQILIEAGADLSASTDLQSFLQNTQLTLSSDANSISIAQPNGKTLNIPAATAVSAGILSSSDFTKLTELPTGSSITSSLATKVDKVAGKSLLLDSIIVDLEQTGPITPALANKVDKETGKGLIDPAPIDGKIYGRYNGGWTQVTSGGGSGDVEEAPIDGKQYARKDAAWTEVEGGGSVNVVQSTGQSITDVMSQKAVTDELLKDSAIIQISIEEVAYLISGEIPSTGVEFLTDLPKGMYFMTNPDVAIEVPFFIVSIFEDPSGGTGCLIYILPPVTSDQLLDNAFLNFTTNPPTRQHDFGEGHGVTTLQNLYLETLDITELFISGVPFTKPNMPGVEGNLAVAGSIVVGFEVQPNTSYYVRGGDGYSTTFPQLSGEKSGTSGATTERFSIHFPLQSHGSSKMMIEWNGCELVYATQFHQRI